MRLRGHTDQGCVSCVCIGAWLLICMKCFSYYMDVYEKHDFSKFISLSAYSEFLNDLEPKEDLFLSDIADQQQPSDRARYMSEWVESDVLDSI